MSCVTRLRSCDVQLVKTNIYIYIPTWCADEVGAAVNFVYGKERKKETNEIFRALYRPRTRLGGVEIYYGPLPYGTVQIWTVFVLSTRSI